MARTSKPAAAKRVRRKRSSPGKKTTALSAAHLKIQEVESLRAEIERLRASAAPPRWNANPDDVQRSVAKLVLTLVDAIRRMEANTLTDAETEAIGLALMRLEETVRDLGAQFGLTPDDLNLDLGPVGKLV
jgi:hypothetical protein